MASITAALSRIKQDLSRFLPEASVHDACRKAGHAWRERKLAPVATIHLFVLQVLAFNTAMTHLRHLAGDAAASAGAYCRARMRLPLAVLQQLLCESSLAMRESLRACAAEADADGQVLWCS